jgi:hypothetical protein
MLDNKYYKNTKNPWSLETVKIVIHPTCNTKKQDTYIQ